MGVLAYSTSMSLDGYIADEAGDFQWAAPTPEVFNQHCRRTDTITTEIMGRKTYDLMRYCQNIPDESSEAEKQFAESWRAVKKIVVSTTLNHNELVAPDGHLVRDLTVEDVADLVQAADGVVSIFGPTTVAPSLRAGLVDIYEFFIVPLMTGGGLRALPDMNVKLVRYECRTFDDGTVFVRYGKAGS